MVGNVVAGAAACARARKIVLCFIVFLLAPWWVQGWRRGAAVLQPYMQCSAGSPRWLCLRRCRASDTEAGPGLVPALRRTLR